MSMQFAKFVSSICRHMPVLESAIMEGYRAIHESATDPLVEDGEEPDENTITMDLDKMADNADQLQALLQEKKNAAATSKAVDEKILAMGNASDSARG